MPMKTVGVSAVFSGAGKPSHGAGEDLPLRPARACPCARREHALAQLPYFVKMYIYTPIRRK